MRSAFCSNRHIVHLTGLALILCIAAAALPAWAEEEPGTALIPTIYRDSWKLTVNGKPQTNGTFTMVFTPLKGNRSSSPSTWLQR